MEGRVARGGEGVPAVQDLHPARRVSGGTGEKVRRRERRRDADPRLRARAKTTRDARRRERAHERWGRALGRNETIRYHLICTRGARAPRGFDRALMIEFQIEYVTTNRSSRRRSPSSAFVVLRMVDSPIRVVVRRPSFVVASRVSERSAPHASKRGVSERAHLRFSSRATRRAVTGSRRGRISRRAAW